MSEFKGQTGRILTEAETITIVRDTPASNVSHGAVPPWRIPLAAVTDVRFVEPTRFRSGKIQIIIGTFQPSDGSAAAADTVLFGYGQRDQFRELAQRLRSAVEANRQAGIDSANVAVDPPPSAGLGARIRSGASLVQAALDSAQARRDALDDAQQADSSSRGVLFVGTSHEEGRNAKVTLYSDRIERVKERSALSLSSARQDVEITPIRSVSSVQAKKDGMRTNVTVYASGNNIEFRFRHAEASQFREALMRLITAPAPAAAPAPSTSPGRDPIEQLKRLAELRDAGIVTADEFEAKKAEMLKRL